MNQVSDPGRPAPDEYLDYYEYYIALVGEGHIIDLLEAQIAQWHSVLDGVSAEQADTIHEPYSWTLKQVIGHMLDNERIFGYRAARFAAKDSTPLPGYDQDAYAVDTDYSNVTMSSLVDEMDHLRRGNILMFKRQTESSWMLSGLGDGKKMTVRAAAYNLTGHVIHHLRIIEQRLAQ